MHRASESKTKDTTSFGVRVPDVVLHEFELVRLKYRRDLEHRQDAVIEAMRKWTEQQGENPVNEYIERNGEAA